MISSKCPLDPYLIPMIARWYKNLGASPWSPWPYFKLDCRRRRRPIFQMSRRGIRVNTYLCGVKKGIVNRTRTIMYHCTQYNYVPKQYQIVYFHGTISIEYIYVPIGVHLFWINCCVILIHLCATNIMIVQSTTFKAYDWQYPFLPHTNTYEKRTGCVVARSGMLDTFHTLYLVKTRL